MADYRGYGLSTGNPSLSHIVRDTHPIFRRFTEIIHDGGYPEAIFIMGRSLGSAPALEAASHYQDEVRGLIVESGFSDAFRLLSYLGLPVEAPPNHLGDFPNGERMRSIHLPTLLIHAADDHLIPVQEAEELYRLCASDEKRLVVIPRADHNTLMMAGRDRYFQAIEEFIHRYV